MALRVRRKRDVMRRAMAIAGVLAIPLWSCADGNGLEGARGLIDAGRFAEAKQAFEALAARSANDAEAILFLGEIALQSNDPEAAVARFENCVAAAPATSRVPGVSMWKKRCVCPTQANQPSTTGFHKGP